MAVVFQDVTERRRGEDALRQREAELARVQRIGEVGGLDVDVARGLTSRRSPDHLRLHGLPDDGGMETHQDWLDRILRLVGAHLDVTGHRRREAGAGDASR